MLFLQLTIDANDPPALARFWSAALGWTGTPPTEPDTTWWDHFRALLGDEDAFEDRLFDPEGLRPPLWFQEVPETKSGKNRLHLDLYPTGRDRGLSPEDRVRIVEAKVDELVALGASVVTRHHLDHRDEFYHFVVMQDPEGNEFCVS